MIWVLAKGNDAFVSAQPAKAVFKKEYGCQQRDIASYVSPNDVVRRVQRDSQPLDTSVCNRLQYILA
jgi:hypothetical protein